MMSGIAIGGVVSHLVVLVVGYFLRHKEVPVPLLPAPVPATPSPAPQVSLIKEALGVAEAEAEKLLAQAVRSVISQGLADLQARAAQAK